MSYQPKNPIRIVTAASLFDGHDASINIMRRILQDMGAEVIHLAHNRSVYEVVKTAIQEGAQGICVSSYQGGHMEYFKYIKDLLDECGAGYVRIFGGGGGVIIHEEKKALEEYGIAQIFHPDDGRRLGLEGMIELIIKECDFNPLEKIDRSLKIKPLRDSDPVPSVPLGQALTAVELDQPDLNSFQAALGDFYSQEKTSDKTPLVLGMTGTGGAGKSSLIDELLHRFLNAYTDKKVAVVCVDPSKRKTGGALLGDRIRMNSLGRDRVYMRSIASRGSGNEVAQSLPRVLNFLKQCDFDLVIAETSGIGQASTAITEVADLSLYVMTSEFGAQSQLEKIDMIDYADLIAVNKADRRGAEDAVRDVAKQYQRSRKLFEVDPKTLPVYLTQASQFNDGGVNRLFFGLTDLLSEKEPQSQWMLSDEYKESLISSEEHTIIPPDRQNYLAEVVRTVRDYKKDTEEQAEKASLVGAIEKLKSCGLAVSDSELPSLKDLDQKALARWDSLSQTYAEDEYVFQVRDREIRQKLYRESLSGLKIKRVSFPKYKDWGDRLRFLRLENVPGAFPYTAGVFPLKREGEDPKRMFAGEGTPERTNKRFHYLADTEPAKRLSTAFDSVTLYGQDPETRPDIYGKVGESGVSICTLEDMKKLYAGFDLCDPKTSVSMTINGPAPMILAFFFNTAIDQLTEKKEKELGHPLNSEEMEEVQAQALSQVRGTVQADILKEDQGQNTCIFSINFALRMMGDIAEYFAEHKVKNFYSVSISGYHIAEAGANPISQLAFTLANAFTYVEYYLARGLHIDDFAPNLSFFFSNGMDAEYSVIGRVARRIWAVAMRDLYGANERSQKLKYHIQTSGRSLHAQEIQFNDIRTTLQALLATYDNCNSLHTNAYDEAITTPTEESVRRAMAIQMIINKEFGVAMNENSNQGSFFFEELTDLVEEAVLNMFQKISERGGVLGAMETQYQRSKIQEESMYYEHLKHSGALPVVGVNTFIDPETLKEGYVPPRIEMARASEEEKQAQLNNCLSFKDQNQDRAQQELINLRSVALKGGNIFAALMSAARYCSLGQMSQALYEVGGQYRRNL